MSAAEQKEAFESALCGGLEGACSLEVVQAVHEQLTERIDEHKESGSAEPLALTARDVGGILRRCGVEEERVESFQTQCGQSFGESAALNPANLIDSKKFEIRTSQVLISVDPAYSYVVESRVIDGKRYLLIPAGEEVEVNGLAVGLTGEDTP